MLGIDPVEVSVRTAELHSSLDPELRETARFQACTLEELTEEQGEKETAETGAFDAIVASEVIEHLAELDTFIHCCYHLLKVNTQYTLSRTLSVKSCKIMCVCVCV